MTIAAVGEKQEAENCEAPTLAELLAGVRWHTSYCNFAVMEVDMQQEEEEKACFAVLASFARALLPYYERCVLCQPAKF